MQTIGDEIKQKTFQSEYQKAVLNVLLTANILYATNSRFLKGFGLSPEQFNVLRILRGQYPDPCTVLSIQERMLDKMSNASRLVDKLEAKKLLTRKQSSLDRRQVEIKITDNGLTLLKEIDGPMLEMEKRLKCVDDKDLQRFNDILDIIRNNYRENFGDQ